MNPTETERSDEISRLWAEWDELAARHPTPTLDDVRPDLLWIYPHMQEPTFDPEGKYWGRWIAVYQQRVVGDDRDPLALQVRLARELNVHPARIVTTLRGDYR